MSYHDLDFEIDLDVDNAHTRVIRLVGRDKDVLELGCASGYMARVLSERQGCRVTGVESNARAAEKARQFCARVLESDLEDSEALRALEGQVFDVVVCADVLEHVRQPVELLGSLHRVLSEKGFVVASIPNIAHVSVIVELIRGRFEYRDEGLLDHTHVRFFTLESVYDCFERAGYEIAHLEHLRVEPENTEFRTDVSSVSPELLELVRSHPESTTYQFILVARPLGRSGRRPPHTEEKRHAARARSSAAVPERDRGELGASMDALLGRLHFLEDRRESLTRAIGKLREDVLHRDVRIHQLERELDALRRVVEDQGTALRASSDTASRPSLWRRLAGQVKKES